MNEPFIVEEFDGPTADESDVRARWVAETALAAETHPHTPPKSFDAYLSRVRSVLPTDVDLRWNVWTSDRSSVVAIATMGYTTGPTNRHLAFGDGGVLSPHRNQGLGSRLLQLVASEARAVERTTILIDASAGMAADPFLAHRGFEVKFTARVSRMPIAGVDRALMEKWVQQAAERASGYSLVWFDDGVPDEHIDAYVKVGMTMNTAPRDDLDMEDWVDTPEEFRARLEQSAKEGWVAWRVVARHDETGEFVGYTNIHFAPWLGDKANQGGTAVDPNHRNRGIGRWLKAAMALKVRDERPDIQFIDTDNAESNDAMLAINVAMGFREISVEQAWQARVEEVLNFGG